MGILQVPIFKYNEWCRTTAANHAPRGTTALIHRAPQNPTAHACVVAIATSHDGTKQTRYTGILFLRFTFVSNYKKKNNLKVNNI